MKRRLAALALGALLLSHPAGAVSLTLEGAPLELGATPVYENTTYVPLRGALEALRPSARLIWDGTRAVAEEDGLTLTARPGDSYLTRNGVPLPFTGQVRLEAGRTLVPVRALAAALDLQVRWDPASGEVALTAREAPAEGVAGAEDPDVLYWLSRIISAESQGEPLEGKIAVGNVVLNRVASPLFPDTVYGVIFDPSWGGQFAPVRNGTVYHQPTAESVEAAKLCLAGANTAGDSLYFLAPHLTDDHWTMENRTYVTTIGAHWFYQ